jgi:internalin A
LQQLDLTGCRALTNLTPLAGLTGLQQLNLTACSALTNLTLLAVLQGLQQLDLTRCTALTDLTPLAGLIGLQRLDLSGCTGLRDLTALAGLMGLRELNLRGCLLECVPDRCPLPRSGALTRVVADQLRSAPAELGSSSYEDNALLRIRAWQQDLEVGEAASSTLKLFILGNGTVGKTQICRRLRGETFDPSVPSTHGIQQFSVRLFDGDEEMPAVDAHVWDFGGQDVYLGTHALFVDRHAIFVLCWNPRYENTVEFTQHGTLMRNRPLAYWLAYIESLAAEDTPVIVVQTQCDRARDAQPAPSMGTHGLRWVKPVACSAKRRDGMKELLVALESAARGQLEVQGKVRLPQSWVDLGASLDSRGERLLPRGQFDAWCVAHGVSAPPAVVLEYLHRSGAVFWREGLFNDHVVLDQSWALEGIYAILERTTLLPIIREQRGRFSPQLLALTAWRENTEAEREHFLALMLQCQICFQVDEHLYVAPALLPSREDMETRIEREWRGATADAVVRLDYVFVHEGVLRAMLCRLGELAGESAVYWSYGACFYDARNESAVRLSSSLPEASTGQGGWIRVEVTGVKAAELAEYLTDSIRRVSIGRKPTIEWERRPATAVLRDVEHMDQDSTKSPFQLLHPEHRPLASGEPVPVYVSYASDDATIAWVDALVRALPPSLRLLRDKNEVRLGGWISTFMQDIGRAQHVVVVLSTKYLQSQYCMRELLYLHDHSLGVRAELMGRIVPVVMEDLKISDGVSRLAHVIHWQERHTKLEAIINQVGVAAAGGAARDELLAMKDFVHRADELLSWLSDVLMPRVRRGDTQPTIQAVVEVLLQRTAPRDP